MFGHHKHCARKDIYVLVCHVTSHDYVARESCYIMGEFTSSKMTTLRSLVIIDLLKKEILKVQFITWPHMTMTMLSEDHVTTRVSFYLHSHYPAKFCDHRLCRRGGIVFLIGHVTSRDHVVKWVLWYYGWVSLILSPHHAGPMSVFVENT